MQETNIGKSVEIRYLFSKGFYFKGMKGWVLVYPI